MEGKLRYRRSAIAAAFLALAACAPRLEAPRDFNVFFETDRAELTPEAHQVIAQIADDAHKLAPRKIVVAGRADGGTAHDATLADTRATAVIGALLERGVPADQIEKQADAPPPDRTGIAAHQVVVRFLP